MAETNAHATVAVVTVTYNSADVLPDFLDSLAGQTNVTIQLFAIDNASVDQSVAMLRAETRLPMLRVIANVDNLGIAEGNNQGIEAALGAGSDWILLLNNDTLFTPETVANLVAEATAANLDLVSPLIEASDPPNTIWYGGGRLHSIQGMAVRHVDAGAPSYKFPTVLTPMSYASTCALLVRPAIFHSVGLMDPLYFVYFDDVDFAIRATRAGHQFWVTPTARIIHKASSLTGGKESPFTLRWTSRNWPLFVRRNARGLMKPYALIYIQIWALGRLMLGHDTWAVYRQRQSGFLEAMRVNIEMPPPRASNEQKW